MALREMPHDSLATWGAFVTRFPLALRLALVTALSYAGASVIIRQLWSSDNSFRPIYASVVVALVCAALLLPGRSARPRPGPASGASG